MISGELTDQLNAIRRRAQELISGLTTEQFVRRPDPTQWSIIECLCHLNLTAAAVQPKVAAAIEHGRKQSLQGTRPFSPGPMGRLLIWIAEPPPKFRMRAPKKIVPSVQHESPEQVIADFMKFQDGWEKLVHDCDGLDQNKVKVPSLFRGLPRLRLAAPIPWMLAHQRRHLLQAENVKQKILQQASAAKA